MNFNELKEKKVAEIENVLKKYLPNPSGHQKKIMEAMEYNLMAGGKRIRPMLMRETYEMFGGTKEIIEPFMAAIEMIHTYSLIHDDLPSMDNDDYRRGRKTTHIVYGEAMAVLAGDALLNCAFETAAKAFDMDEKDSYLIGKSLQILGAKAGIYGMIGGQVVDVESSGEKIDKDVLDFIYDLKTGALIEASMMIGATLANATEKEVRIIENAAKKVGLAFQIQDDILDVTSTKEVLGKPIYSDEKNDKTTYVTLVGFEKAKEQVEKLSAEAITLMKGLNRDNSYLMTLLEKLIYREK